jgi:hypothetical protein
MFEENRKIEFSSKFGKKIKLRFFGKSFARQKMKTK